MAFDRVLLKPVIHLPKILYNVNYTLSTATAVIALGIESYISKPRTSPSVVHRSNGSVKKVGSRQFRSMLSSFFIGQ